MLLKNFDFSCFVLTRVCTVYGWLITGLLNFGHFLSQLFRDSFKNHLIIHTLIDFLSLINLQKDCTFLSLTNYLVFTTHKKFYEWNYVRWTNFSNNFFLTFLNADSQFLSQILTTESQPKGQGPPCKEVSQSCLQYNFNIY